MKKYASFLLPALVLAPSLQGAIIYRDDFTRTGNLDGSAPTEGTGTWTSRTSTPTTTTGSAATSTSQSTSYLSFVPENGNIYRISVDVSYPTNTNPPTSTVFYGGLGFFSTSAVNVDGVYASSENTPWLFMRGGYNGGATSESARTGDISVRPSPGTTASNNDTNLTTTSPVTLTMTLDTTGSSWVIRSFYTVGGVETELDSNGGLTGLAHTYTTTQTNALRSGANSIQSVGLSNSSTTATPIVWDNFVLETIPEPSTALLSAGGIGLAFIRRRKGA